MAIVLADVKIFSATSVTWSTHPLYRRPSRNPDLEFAPVAPQARLSPIPTQIVDAFRAVAPAIEAFARQHDLLIDRYRRAKPSWHLRFARRIGGGALPTTSSRGHTR